MLLVGVGVSRCCLLLMFILCSIVDDFVVAADDAVATVTGQKQQVDGDEVAWFLLTSSNLSRSAWGFLDKKVKYLRGVMLRKRGSTGFKLLSRPTSQACFEGTGYGTVHTVLFMQITLWVPRWCVQWHFTAVP